MSRKEDILAKLRASAGESHDMPPLDDLDPIAWPDPVPQFVSITEKVGGKALLLPPGADVDAVIRALFPEAERIASHLPEIASATCNPDTAASAGDLDGVDVGVVRGEIGVAENGCVWVPQTMKEKAVCFICEHLVILLPREGIVNNMHEAYKRITFNDYGYGTFISGPSKTADIAQVLVMGAQAARSVTVLVY